MDNSDNWLDWVKLEDELEEDDIRAKIKHKQKSHNKKEWDKINEKLHKNHFSSSF